MGRLEIFGYLARWFANGGLLGVRSNFEGKMMVLDRSIRLLAGKPPPNPDQASVWEMPEEIEYVTATGINKLARHPHGGYRSKYG